MANIISGDQHRRALELIDELDEMLYGAFFKDDSEEAWAAHLDKLRQAVKHELGWREKSNLQWYTEGQADINSRRLAELARFEVDRPA